MGTHNLTVGNKVFIPIKRRYIYENANYKLKTYIGTLVHIGDMFSDVVFKENNEQKPVFTSDLERYIKVGEQLVFPFMEE